MTKTEVLQHDHLMTSIHEAAHTFVARKLGYINAHFRIWPTNTADIAEKTWIGQTYFQKEVAPSDHRLICLAGTIAEQFYHDRDVRGMDIFEYLEDDTIALSQTDAKGAGEYGEDDIDESLNIVKSCWSDIMREYRLRLLADFPTN